MVVYCLFPALAGTAAEHLTITNKVKANNVGVRLTGILREVKEVSNKYRVQNNIKIELELKRLLRR